MGKNKFKKSCVAAYGLTSSKKEMLREACVSCFYDCRSWNSLPEAKGSQSIMEKRHHLGRTDPHRVAIHHMEASSPDWARW